MQKPPVFDCTKTAAYKNTQENMKMTQTNKGIWGKLVDEQSRCEHYHSKLDIIANKCALCKKFYACYKCHNEMENHNFAPASIEEPDTVMCGACGKTYSYKNYSSITACTECGGSFNPNCANHKCIYVF